MHLIFQKQKLNGDAAAKEREKIKFASSVNQSDRVSGFAICLTVFAAGKTKLGDFRVKQQCKYDRKSKFRVGRKKSKSKVPDNVKNKALYRKIKAKVKRQFQKKPNGAWPSAYGSMALVRAYKKAGGKYENKKSKKKSKRRKQSFSMKPGNCKYVKSIRKNKSKFGRMKARRFRMTAGCKYNISVDRLIRAHRLTVDTPETLALGSGGNGHTLREDLKRFGLGGGR